MSAASPKTQSFWRRYPYCCGCILATIALLGACWLLRDMIATLQLIQADKARQGEAMLSTLVSGSTTRQELADVREAVRRIEENLVIETNLAENLWYFYKLEEQTKVRLPELHQLSSPANDASTIFRRVPYNLRVTGTYDQVASFLLALETGPRLLKITSFNFGRVDPTGGLLALDLSIELLGKKS